MSALEPQQPRPRPQLFWVGDMVVVAEDRTTRTEGSTGIVTHYDGDNGYYVRLDDGQEFPYLGDELVPA